MSPDCTKSKMVGASGFEPPASCSRSRRASQAALRPDNRHGTRSLLFDRMDPFRVAHPQAKKEPPESFHSPAAIPFAIESLLELEPQRKLHDARVRQQTGVVAEGGGDIQFRENGLNVKSGRIRYVEYFPAELKRLALGPRHLPAFRKPQVDVEEALAADL